MKHLFLCILFLSVFFSLAQNPCQSGRHGNSGVQTAPANLRSDTIDVLDEDIHIDITDFVKDTIRGYTAIKFAPKMNGQSHITLDLLAMKIDSITCLGQQLSYSYNDTILVANLPGTYNTSDTLTTKVYYHGVPQADPSGWGGFSISGAYAYNLGVGFSPNFHNFGRCWFPCFDNFFERCTFTFNIVSPPGKKAVCNGVLVKDSTATNNYRTWRLNIPIPTYLASVAVSNYAEVHQTFTGINGNVPVILAALPADTNKLKSSFINLEAAFDCFENHFGPYKWPRVGYVCVPFNSGAMEHATNIAYPLPFVNGATTYEDVLMAHELSHHWWGDLVTCETAQEMYINEGFASFCQLLFNECVYGNTTYMQKALDNHDNALHNAHFADKGFLTMANVPLAYTYGDHSYNKGADLAYTLRGYMGDSLFFEGMKYVLQQKTYKSMNSVEFDTILTNHTGYNTNSFFTNWINTPGWPHFSIDSMQVNGNSATVFVRQRLFGAPSYYSNVPLEIVFMDANRIQSLQTISMSGALASFTFNLPFTPVYAGINFNNRISDAITSTKMTIFGSGYITYVHGRATLGMYTNGPDSTFLRIEHNFVKPDAIKNNVNNYRISDQHYWKVDGIVSPGFRANCKFYFNGKKLVNRTPGSMDYSDTLLTQFTTDSIIFLYRKNTADDWREVDKYTKTKIGLGNSMYGYVVVDTLKVGEYCFANGVSTVIGVKDRDINKNVNIYPNPAAEKIMIDLGRGALIPERTTCRIYTVEGRKVLEMEFEGAETGIDISGLAKGYYTIKLEGKDFSCSHKLIVNPK